MPYKATDAIFSNIICLTDKINRMGKYIHVIHKRTIIEVTLAIEVTLKGKEHFTMTVNVRTITSSLAPNIHYFHTTQDLLHTLTELFHESLNDLIETKKEIDAMLS